MPTGAYRSSRRLWWTIGVFIAVLAAGLGLFALALRSCRFVLEPGQAATWTLTVRSASLLQDGKPGMERSASHRIVLLGLGPESSSAAWLAGPASGPATSLRLIELPSDGRLRHRGRDGRLGEGAPQLAGFDFNLLPLPLAAEQEWKPEVMWAALPEGRRTVACSVKRMRMGARPEFKCDFPVSVEWVDPTTGRYRQVRELTSTYRFDTLRGLPYSARIAFTMREELPPPGGYASRRIVLELAWVGSEDAGEPRGLREAAADGAAAESWVANQRRPPDALLARLRGAEGPLRGLADGLLSRLGGQR